MKRHERNSCVIVDSLEKLGSSPTDAIAAIVEIARSDRDLISFAEDINTQDYGRDFLEHVCVLAESLGLVNTQGVSADATMLEDVSMPTPEHTDSSADIPKNNKPSRGRPVKHAEAKTKARYLYLQGKLIEEIIEATGLSRATVYRALKENDDVAVGASGAQAPDI